MDNEKIYKLLDCELEKIAAKPELNDAMLSNLYKLVDVKKDLLEIEEKEMKADEMESGNSYRMYNTDRGGRNSYRRGGNSNRRGMSRYYNDGYSMDDGGDILDYLEEAMSHARTEQEREAIRQTMMKLDK